mmetsp:Transcript_2671/g.7360  ORF Transcript_2671/g.7360 Transcript_2671/m.7360 type:complete len:516 (+) Transcript_2671:359-1906(+)
MAPQSHSNSKRKKQKQKQKQKSNDPSHKSATKKQRNREQENEQKQRDKSAAMTIETAASSASSCSMSSKDSNKLQMERSSLHSISTSTTKRMSNISNGNNTTEIQQRLRAYHQRGNSSDHNDGSDGDIENANPQAVASNARGMRLSSSSKQNKHGTDEEDPYHDEIHEHDDDEHDDDNDNERCELTKEDKKLIQLLAAQAYHLPGHSAYQDWVQYVWTNNHPIFGLCFHHKLHPIKYQSRIFALVGLVLFGLILTNAIYLASMTEEYSSLNDSFVTVVVGGDESENDVSDGNSDNDNDGSDNNNEAPAYYTITFGMIMLWTFGSMLHTAFSLIIWQMAACGCCRSGGRLERYACCPSFGKRLVRMVVLALFLAAIAIVMTRESVDSSASTTTIVSQQVTKYINTTQLFNTTGTGNNDPNQQQQQQPIVPQIDPNHDERRSFQFLVGYSVELVLTMFVYYPIGATILFSGIFGCYGRIPVLGGRPRELLLIRQREERKQQRQERKKQRQQKRQGCT